MCYLKVGLPPSLVFGIAATSTHLFRTCAAKFGLGSNLVDASREPPQL